MFTEDTITNHHLNPSKTRLVHVYIEKKELKQFVKLFGFTTSN